MSQLNEKFAIVLRVNANVWVNWTQPCWRSSLGAGMQDKTFAITLHYWMQPWFTSADSKRKINWKAATLCHQYMYTVSETLYDTVHCGERSDSLLDTHVSLYRLLRSCSVLSITLYQNNSVFQARHHLNIPIKRKRPTAKTLWSNYRFCNLIWVFTECTCNYSRSCLASSLKIPFSKPSIGKDISIGCS